ncbi:MAG: AAC(3) family N-acetyltransferase [Anaerolineales bacterium]
MISAASAAETVVAKKSKTIGYRDIVRGLEQVGVSDRARRVIVHASLSSLGNVRGGAETLLAALTSECHTVVMPAFTYQTLVVPETGPPDNGMTYGSASEKNQRAEFWHADLPVHPEIGAAAEQLRQLEGSVRSDHPVLSFVAYGEDAQEVMGAQSHDDPFGPISWLADHDGDVLLIGVSHRVNTAIHLAEQRAGRKSFVRWALTERGAVEVPHWPGNSGGFDAIAPYVAEFTARGQIGTANVQRIPLVELLDAATSLLREQPDALLTDDPTDERSAAIRRALEAS